MNTDNRFKQRAINLYGVVPVQHMLQIVTTCLAQHGLEITRERHGIFTALHDDAALSISEEIYDHIASERPMSSIIDEYGDLMCLADDTSRVFLTKDDIKDEGNAYAYLEYTI